LANFQKNWFRDVEKSVSGKEDLKTNDMSKPGIQRVQALADILRLALCCHSNETHALIANLPNSAHN